MEDINGLHSHSHSNSNSEIIALIKDFESRANQIINFSICHQDVWINIEFNNNNFKQDKQLFDLIVNKVIKKDIFVNLVYKDKFLFQANSASSKFQIKCVETRSFEKHEFRMNGASTRLANEYIEKLYNEPNKFINIRSEWKTYTDDKNLFGFIKRRLSIENYLDLFEFTLDNMTSNFNIRLIKKSDEKEI
jgi:hypothetical protein